jgi:hypothetical protein
MLSIWYNTCTGQRSVTRAKKEIRFLLKPGSAPGKDSERPK